MNLDDIKEQLLNIWNRIWEKIQESNLYIQLKDRFDSLPPQGQKTTVLAIAGACYFFLMMIPYSWYTETQSKIETFESRRSVIRELLKVSREVSDVPNLPVPPPAETIKVDATNRTKEVNLLDEQIKSVELTSEGSQLIPQDKSSGNVKVEVSQLNLRQVVDLGSKLTRMNQSIKLTDLVVKSTAANPHYFDVTYKLTALAIPEINQPESPE